jgi:hypothetical protein
MMTGKKWKVSVFRVFFTEMVTVETQGAIWGAVKNSGYCFVVVLVNGGGGGGGV